MVVSLLLKILEKYSLCENGVKVQFVTHKNGSFWSDEVYDGNILVTPYDKDGNLNHYSAMYYDDVNFKSLDKRNSFCELMDLYNKSNLGEDDFVPLDWLGSNYCTIH